MSGATVDRLRRGGVGLLALAAVGLLVAAIAAAATRPGTDAVTTVSRVAAAGCALSTTGMAGVLVAAELDRVELAVQPLPAVGGALGTTGALVAGVYTVPDPTLVAVLVVPAVLVVLGAALLVGVGVYGRT